MKHAWIIVLGGAFLATGAVAAGGGAYDSTRHGDPVSGVARRPGLETGDCGHCHEAHGSVEGSSDEPFEQLLFTSNDDGLCFECHQDEGAAKVYLGQGEATANAHATSPSCVWPGPDPPARPLGDAGKCLNCHDPHGRKDDAGVVPVMSVAREETQCLTCHDANGPADDDIHSQILKASRHPVLSFTGRHDIGEGGDPDAFRGARRHAECEDCHNPHACGESTGLSQAPRAGEPLRGVPFLEVSNGPAGTAPGYQWRDGSQALNPIPNEFQVCFRCHSGWSQFGREDLGMTLNPNNPSYHPVEAVGRDPRIPSGAFSNGITAQSIVLCSDCHRSSDPFDPAGPHGSDERALLAGWYPSTSQAQEMPRDSICFQCHAYEVYAQESSTDAILGLSRFNPPAESKGHAFHVGQEGYPCSACHVVHGSTTQPSLIRIGAEPGITGYLQNRIGGSCGASCHGGGGVEDYTEINYPR